MASRYLLPFSSVNADRSESRRVVALLAHPDESTCSSQTTGARNCSTPSLRCPCPAKSCWSKWAEPYHIAPSLFTGRLQTTTQRARAMRFYGFPCLMLACPNNGTHRPTLTANMCRGCLGQVCMQLPVLARVCAVSSVAKDRRKSHQFCNMGWS